MSIRRGILLDPGASGGGSGTTQTGDGSTSGTSTQSSGTSAGTGNTDSQGTQGTGTQTSTEHQIPKARFDEVNSEVKKLRKQVEDAETERRKREEADATQRGEFEKLANTRAQEIAALNGKIVQLTEETKQRETRHALVSAAHKADAIDADDVYALVDKAQVAYADDGSVTNADALVTALLEKKPHLKKAGTAATTGQSAAVPPTPKPGGHAATDDPAALAASARMYRARF